MSLPAAPASVPQLLRALALLVAAAMALMGTVAVLALSRTQAVTQTVVRHTAALSQLQVADMAHDGLRSAVYAALLVQHEPALLDAEAVRRDASLHAHAMRDAMGRLADIDVDPALSEDLARTQTLVSTYVDRAEAGVVAALVDPRRARAELAGFAPLFDELRRVFEQQVLRLRAHNEAAIAQADALKLQATVAVLATALACLLVTVTLAARIGRAIRASLRRVQTVATAVAGGDIDQRCSVDGDDEVGRLGRAVNAMADKLQQMLAGALADTERHSFGRELGEALEMADSEPEAYRVVQRAMLAVADDRRMELLVSDSSHAVLQRATEHPQAGAPGCTVASPFVCQAVRQGRSLSFDNSEALNACPRLRERPGDDGPVSALCVPLHFMGRAVGVLHATGAVQQPMTARQQQQMADLGAQAAARIGVVRAFERTQLQAATDALTGLVNRRALEAAVRDLMLKKKPFALLMADLDRFKLLNDTHGHLVGDKALCLFADEMRQSVRDVDTVARFGGEEFALVLVGSSAADAVRWADRARARLAQALGAGQVPKFTASFGVADSHMAGRYEDLLRIADEALYRSKADGRDRATLGHPAAANEPLTRQASEHEERIDVQRLTDMVCAEPLRAC